LPQTLVVADMEAGLEHLSWAGGTLRDVDLLLVVLQPTGKVLLTADRIHRLAVELGIADIAFVGNRAGPADHQRLADFAASRGRALLAVIPEDEAVHEAERRALCVLDWAPQSPAVRALEELARVLDERIESS